MKERVPETLLLQRLPAGDLGTNVVFLIEVFCASTMDILSWA